ncbi:MAG: TniQ family protein [Hydrogenophaga sp.]|nr:TniQ family protein [Hydrogenophaga sp.]
MEIPVEQEPAPIRTLDRPLLSWLPGETLFSLVSRHHRLWGHDAPWRTADALFGGRRIGVHHDFPSGLGRFCAITHGLLGDVQSVGRERTLLRYYLPFLAPDLTVGALSTMQGDSVAHLKFRLGLLTGRFGANHALKACLSCMRDDFEQYGWYYWHLEHQYPGVWMCRHHGTPILRSTVKSTGVERFGWHLPDISRLVQDWPHDTYPDEGALVAFSELVSALVELPVEDGWLSRNVVQGQVKNCIEERGWLSPNGTVMLNAMAKSFLAFSKPLRILPELSMLPSNLDEATAHVSHLLRPIRTGSHPLRLLLALKWVFQEPEDFVKRYLVPLPACRNQRTDSTGTAPFAGTKRAEHEKHSQVLAMIKKGTSARSAAKVSGVDVGTVMAWAVKAGFCVSRRPKRLKSEVLVLLINDLQRGTGRKEAALQHGVSLATISRVFQSYPSVHAEWKAARDTAARHQARQDWALVVAAYPHIGTTLLRAMSPCAYSWLYRNDRDWLKLHSGSIKVSRPPRTSRVRWDERDTALSAAVQQAVLRLHEQDNGKQLRLWQIFQAVPELKRRLSALHRLVLTKRVLEQALRR